MNEPVIKAIAWKPFMEMLRDGDASKMELFDDGDMSIDGVRYHMEPLTDRERVDAHTNHSDLLTAAGLKIRAAHVHGSKETSK
jgi:hypothetical protein